MTQRHADSVVTDDVLPLPSPPSVFAYLRTRNKRSGRKLRRVLVPLEPFGQRITILPATACACAETPYGMSTTCLEHANQEQQS